MELQRMKVSVRSYAGREEMHVHPYTQIALPVSGTMDVVVGDVRVGDSHGGAISRQHGVVIASGARHVFRAAPQNRFIILDLPAGAMRRATSASPFFAVDERLEALARYAGQELAAGGIGDETEYHLASLLAGGIRRCVPPAPAERGPIETALDIMRARYAERLTVASLARAAGLAASQFHALFRRETGASPARALAEIRLDRAGELLLGTSLPIAEIALMVGFSDQSALTRCFRRRRGVTPDALRKDRG
jgi:transcriptional regulator GlxA family with amidase domain